PAQTGEGPDPHETRFFDKICRSAAPGKQLLTPAHVADAFRSLEASTGGKVLFNGVVYLDNAAAQARVTGAEDENEKGHGILDLISLWDHGKPADLASVDRNNPKASFATILEELAKYTAFEMEYNSSFKCTSRTHPAAVNGTTVELTIQDQNGKEVARYSGRCTPNQQTCQFGDGAVITRYSENSKGIPYTTFSVMIRRNSPKFLRNAA
ncbi:MAG: hypothetical protein HC902_14840, partial [Calothrix sp. SM1_5_4]|nr:hypothetical protein [Calothrix sp. SM1_5_4]